MLATVILGTVAIILAIPLVLQFWELPVELRANYATLQSLSTTVALALAGIWAYFQFVLFRNYHPHLTVLQDVSYRLINPEYFHIAVVALLNNTSRVKVEIQKVSFQLLQIAPVSSEEAERLRDEVFESNFQEDLQWPLRHERTREWQANACIVEPGETLEVTCEFIVPSSMQSVLVYTYVHNSQYSEKSDGVQGWPKSTVRDLTMAYQNQIQ